VKGNNQIVEAPERRSAFALGDLGDFINFYFRFRRPLVGRLALAKIEADLGEAASFRNLEVMIARLQEKEVESWSYGTKVSDVHMIPRIRIFRRNVYFCL
jgi:hypothetical protein